MSVKLGLLALLAEEPMYGARLRAEFEARTGGTWPLNVGQVYTTLARLERDGLVEAVAEDAEGRIAYRLTGAGRAEVAQWWLSPVDRDATPRDELVIKLALAVTVEGVDVPRVVQTQRTATLRHLQSLTRLKQRATAGDADTDLAWLLVLEHRSTPPRRRSAGSTTSRRGWHGRRAGHDGEPPANRPRTRLTSAAPNPGGQGHEQGADPQAGQRHPRPRRRDRHRACPRWGEHGGQRRRAGRGDGPERVRQARPGSTSRAASTPPRAGRS